MTANAPVSTADPVPWPSVTTVLDHGLTLIRRPPLSHPLSVLHPPADGDTIVYLPDGSASLSAVQVPEFDGRVLKARSCLALPAGASGTWTGQGGIVELRVARDLHADWQTRHGPCAFRVQANIRDRDLTLTFAAIDRLLSGDVPFRDLALSGLALGAVARLLVLQQASGGTRPASGALTPARLRRVRAHVAANLSRDLTLRDLAGSVGLSPGHFGRAFKAETGQSPYAYVLQMRVKRVQHLLCHGGWSLAEIALDCGFATQSHMTETFRRLTGLPPAQWRRLHGAVSRGL